jgi:hypothetical protein
VHSAADVTRAFIDHSMLELDDSFRKVLHCFDQLSEEDVWWGPEVHINSIGTILAHLSGNLRQWVLSGLGGAPDLRNRPAEFEPRAPVSKAELRNELETLVQEIHRVVEGLDPDAILEPRRIQGFDETVLSALYGTIAHFKAHVLQIMQITRMRAGDRYRLFWQPANKEQGAPEAP